MIESQYVSSVFDISCKTAETSWEAAAWASEENQKFLFDWCLSSIGESEVDSVLDVGCGQGDLSTRIKNYTGIDISGEMIKKAQEKYPKAKFIHTDVDEFTTVHDWVVAIGPFNLDVLFSTEDLLPNNLRESMQMKYLEEAIRHMYRLCRKGIAVTILSDSLVKEKHVGLFYYKTKEVIEICLKINKRFMLDHMSSPTQFLVYIPKGQP